MKFVIPFSAVGEDDRSRVGPKGYVLAKLMQMQLSIPDGVCISVDGYREYVERTGLLERIMLEVNRKPFNEMRWEEIWDASLRIRNMFLATPLPENLDKKIRKDIADEFGEKSVVIRSSSPSEDTRKTSFAGIHESYVNIRGIDHIVKHVRLVWASLWSNRALLYRQELDLDIGKSDMAVVIQELVSGEKSGIMFGKNPIDSSQSVVEAVYGLNEGLVDGTIEPDRWIIDRETGSIVSHTPANRERMIRLSEKGTVIKNLPPKLRAEVPLNQEEIVILIDTSKKLESIFGAPQDIEWTIKDGKLSILQSRPITTIEKKEDEKLFYVNLQRSFLGLKELRDKIENRYIPEMIEEANNLGKRDLFAMSNEELAKEINERIEKFSYWVNIYWEFFIPFAHGARLFGQVYNDTLIPDDPFEFIELLKTDEMESIKRNRMMAELAGMIRSDPDLALLLKTGTNTEKHLDFHKELHRFISRYGSAFLHSESDLLALLLEMARKPPSADFQNKKNVKELEAVFLNSFTGTQREFATQLLDLGRASYRLRDDDNIYLGKIENRMTEAIDRGRSVIESRLKSLPDDVDKEEVVKALLDDRYVPQKKGISKNRKSKSLVRTRQLRGQPASQGIASGRARVIRQNSDLFQFQGGEILVIDAIDPNSTFVVPLAEGIIERRGGMLIHGAIVAREYGIPCITGIPDATSIIDTGDAVVIDGFLGIVTIEGKK